MTPAERDEVRLIAQSSLAAHANCRRLADGPCTCDDCAGWRAIVRYVPPGDASDIEVSRSLDAVLIDIREGSAYSSAGARSLAHALHAAADAAEED